MTLRVRAKSFVEAGVLGPLEVHVVERLAAAVGLVDDDVQLGLAFAVRAPRVGHVGVDLGTVAVDSELPLAWPADRAAWHARTAACALVGEDRPFVHVGGLVVTRRYHAYQARIASAFVARAKTTMVPDAAALHKQLDQLFGPPRGGEPDLQRLAALVAVLRPLTVISGGPGTGKTYTVKKLLALLESRHFAETGLQPRVALAAPTGKAAARMKQAIGEGLEKLKPPRVRAFLRQQTPVTLHRLLGWDPRNPTRFRHDAAHPLPHEIVVVDEASMIDLAMLAKLVDAVRPDARLILLGDRHQLASVEAGSALADLVSGTGPRGMRLPTELAARIREIDDMFAVIGLEDATAPPFAGGLVQLSRPYRFGASTGVGQLAHAIGRGDTAEALRLLHDPAIADVSLGRADEASIGAALRAGYRPFLEAATRGAEPRVVLDAFERFRVLSAHRKGRRGVEGLRELAGRVLYDEFPEARGTRPVLITENAPEVGRWNGDIGVVLGERAYFLGGEEVERLEASRLPPHEAPFAMTVHKAQGSQVDDVVLVLPERPSSILTRELIYTAVTRARVSVRILGDEAVLRAALSRTIERASALPALLWGET
ncbi:MAG: exodeoxyribonuclease V subunit alpha [Myxococcales bacterium]|nr:exodeoxyribonuclease V subunit alpha [Myxococcales bacterium]